MIQTSHIFCFFTNVLDSINQHPILSGIIGSIIAAIIIYLFNRGKKRVKLITNNSTHLTEYITKHSPIGLYNEYKDKIYIQPYITDTPIPASIEPDKSELKNKKLLRDYFINEVFTDKHKGNTVFFIFGDTGTGKTAALIHLFVDYLEQFKDDRPTTQIRLISLREGNAFADITSIPKEERKNLILLLDAMDETPEVKNPIQYDSFLNKLKEPFHDFARVVITCRPQFFPNKVLQDSFIKPGILISTGWLKCAIKYLAPFDNTQVQEFLDQAITLRSEDPKRRKAEEIVKMKPAITIRPLVLSFIKEIVQTNRPIKTSLDLFDAIIESILNRDIYKTLGLENNKEKKLQWWEASSLVAKYMYENQKLNITDSELDNILPNEIEKQFKQRSLLTRYGNEYHFSHKSFYEYFMAYRFLQHPDEIKQVYGMDFALQIYNDALQAWSKQKDTPFADLKNTHPYTVASSLTCIGYALYGINHFSEAEHYYKLALELFRLLEEEKNDTYKDDIAMVLNNLAVLHRNTNQYKEAEEEYNEALTTYRQLADKNPDAYLPDVAMTLNNLANLHQNTNQLDKAEEEYNEALTTYHQLADKNPDAYLPYVATTLNNLGLLHSDTNQLDKAEEEYNEALTTYRQLADKNPDAYLPDVAMTLNNLAVLHRNTNQYKEAEEEYNEALTTYRQLADKNPDAYLPDVAMTLNNLANLHSDTNQLDKAEEEYNEALTIRCKLADKNPDAYLQYVADTLENLAVLHCVTDRLQDAEEEYKDVLSIRQALAEKNPDAYLHKVAGTLYNMALLHLSKDEKDLPAAEAAAQESLEKYRIMAEKSHARFDGDVKDAKELLEDIRKAKEAEE